MSGIPGGQNQNPTKSSFKMRALFVMILSGMTIGLYSSCRRQDSYPKPKAYPRIDYPQTGYNRATALPYPVTFEYPASAKLVIPEGKAQGQNWINLRFDIFRATLLTSYLQTDRKNMEQHILDNESLLDKETPAYAPVRKQEFKSMDGKVTGYLYEIRGNTASPLQFILTDGENQLFRGALYFDYLPNRDSINDIVQGLSTDIQYLMESFKFKN